MACLAWVGILRNFTVHRPRHPEEKSGEEKTLTCLSPKATHQDVELQKDGEKTGVDYLACDIYLRVIILPLSLLNWHSLVNYCVIGSNYRQVCLPKPQFKNWRLNPYPSFLLRIDDCGVNVDATQSTASICDLKIISLMSLWNHSLPLLTAVCFHKVNKNSICSNNSQHQWLRHIAEHNRVKIRRIICTTFKSHIIIGPGWYFDIK